MGINLSWTPLGWLWWASCFMLKQKACSSNKGCPCSSAGENCERKTIWMQYWWQGCFFINSRVDLGFWWDWWGTWSLILAQWPFSFHFPLYIYIVFPVWHNVHAFIWLTKLEVHRIHQQMMSINDTTTPIHLQLPLNDHWLNGCIWKMWSEVAFSTNPTGSLGSCHWLSSETSKH